MGLCCHLVATGMITEVDEFHWMAHPGPNEAQGEGGLWRSLDVSLLIVKTLFTQRFPGPYLNISRDGEFTA